MQRGVVTYRDKRFDVAQKIRADEIPLDDVFKTNLKQFYQLDIPNFEGLSMSIHRLKNFVSDVG